MNPYAMNDDKLNAAAIVRRNAGPAALAAALMIYFGFFSLLYPTGSDLFSICGKILYFTLRIGGVAMAIVALWCMVGQRHALLADAVASVIIGGLLIATGIGMFVDGGGAMQSVLYVVFGGMFVSAGRHNWHHYSSITTNQTRYASQQTSKTFDAPPPIPQKTTGPTTTERLRALKTRDAAAQHESAGPPPPVDAGPAAPPPGGYLASFGDVPPPDDSNKS